MAFVSVPGLKGKVFIPQESTRSFKKKPCKDCFSCQQCSDDRCRVCRGQRDRRCDTRSDLKLSVSKDDCEKSWCGGHRDSGDLDSACSD